MVYATQRFYPVSLYSQVWQSLKNSVTPQPGGLTSFQALCTSLAARVGSGNLAGVALAISAGGPARSSGCG
jgi:Na+/alanine symporter